MSAQPHERPELPEEARRQRNPELRAASLSALEEAVRRALELASREQILHRVATCMPAESEDTPEAGLHGKVQKVSVSMPAELTDAVRARTGTGGFSRYVTEAVQERVRLDLLDELSAELEAEYGPIPAEIRAKTRQLWPDEIT